ncbi:DUF3300 domain-containing protein, partial [Pseudomonas sp.]|uniref:DUF3300 domain-containing protein n=1 Tax=Pseudomonas sp. TaxID=306 RepID=UPI003C33B602
MKGEHRMGRGALGLVCGVALIAFSLGPPVAAQQLPPPLPPAPQQPQAAALLSPQQLDNLVAPITLYPDNLLSQLLAASTYPLELVEAEQWLQQNQNLQGQQLVDAARQQPWDPSVQALVVFPDVLARLTSDIRWTTDLGNAFLAQQGDVMSAIQQLRAQARAAGQLNSNPEDTIATDTQGGQTAIQIQPTNPEQVYVPEYNPEDVWGPPAYGYYPPLDYPDYGWGFGFEPPIYIGGFFGGLGWGGWGWGCNWFGGSLFLNVGFFNHYGFGGGFYGRGGFGGRGFGGRETWVHNPAHRMGVGYSNRAVASRFGGTYGGRGNLGGRGSFGNTRASGSFARGNSSFAGRGSFGSRGATPAYRSSPSFGGNRSYGGASGFRSTPAYRSTPAFGGNRSFGGSNSFRSAPAFNRSYGGFRSAPAFRSTPSFGGGRSFGGGGFRSAPSFSGRSGGSFRGFGGGG